MLYWVFSGFYQHNLTEGCRHRAVPTDITLAYLDLATFKTNMVQ